MTRLADSPSWRPTRWLWRLLVALALLALLLLTPATAWVAHGGTSPPTPPQRGEGSRWASTNAPVRAPILPSPRWGGVGGEVLPAQATPLPVRVALYLLSVDRFDLATKSYTLDFYLTLRCDQPCEMGNFEFANGRATTSELYQETPTMRAYRVLATFSEDLDLRAYPFDAHSLDIIIENKTLTADQLVYVVDAEATRIDPSVRVLGWQLQRDWTAEVADRYYPGRNETYSRYAFAIYLHRPAVAAVIRSLLPALFIMAVAFISLVLGAKELSQRLTIGTSSLLGAMLFHLSLAGALPHLDYLTLADRFMIINYAALVGCIGSTVVMILVTDMGRRTEAEHLRWLFLAAIPLSWLLLQAISAVLR